MTKILILFTLLSNSLIAKAKEDVSQLYWTINPNSKAHVNLAESLNIVGVGSNKIKIAVIDTGLQKNHKDLSHSILIKNKKIIAKDFSEVTIDQSISKRIISSNVDSYPDDTHGHGTHISGIISSRYNKKNGTVGIAPLSKIIPIKYYNPNSSGQTNLRNEIKSLQWALEQNVDIVNFSGGGPEHSLAEYLVLKEFEKRGIPVVVAAGNESENLDQIDPITKTQNNYYPCSYNLTNIICVGASDKNINKINASNWSKEKVHIFAPGNRIKSVIPNHGTGYMTGTSQATAFVSGAVALIKSANPELTAFQIKKLIMQTSTKYDQLKKYSVNGGYLNIGEAVKISKKMRILKK